MRPAIRVTLLLLVTLSLGGCALFGAGQVPPLPPGTNECIGLERPVCLQVLDNLSSGRDVEPAAWRVRCTGVCDQNRGEAEVTITWPDGTTQMASTGWSGAVGAPAGPGRPIPTPQVPPTCIRVPQAQCNDQWSSGTQDLTADQRGNVAAVEVECTTVCTPIEGAGRTTIVLEDGTRILAFDWIYGGP